MAVTIDRRVQFGEPGWIAPGVTRNRCGHTAPGHPEFWCSRDPGHTGPHACHGLPPVLLAWDNE